jgi:hypothetical protein
VTCPGPLIWRDADSMAPERGAILECAHTDCGYVVITGSVNDEAHSATPVMREGLATP